MKCVECAGKMLRTTATGKNPYRFVESGLDNVYLVGIATYSCPNCHESVAEIPCVEKLHRVIAEQIIQFPRILTGSEIRFLRKDLELKAVEFAQFLHTTPVTVSRWETGSEPIGKASDQQVRLFYKVYREEKKRNPVEADIIGKLSGTDEGRRDIRINLTVGDNCRMSARRIAVAA